MEEINTELLISLIEERPAIWDKTLNIYKDKNIKESAWREICVILKEDFEEKEQKERQEFGKLVLKKWTHIRDSWSKSIKRHKEQKQSGSSAKSSKLYVFHEQMSFLNKIIDTTVAHESINNNKNEENKSDDANYEAKNQDEIVEVAEKRRSIPEAVSKTSTATTQRKRKCEIKNELDAKMIKFIDHQIMPKNENHNENRHLSFFKSLLPSLSLFNDDETLEFQSGILNLLQNLKRKKQMILNNPPHYSKQLDHYEYQNPVYYNQPQINTVPLPMMSPGGEPVKSPAALSTISSTSQASDCSLIDLDLQNF